MPSKKRRHEFKEPARRNSKRRHKSVSDTEDVKENQSEMSLEDEASISTLAEERSKQEITDSTGATTCKTITTIASSLAEDEQVEISTKSTQTAPSHKDQASSTQNHVVNPNKENIIKMKRSSRKSAQFTPAPPVLGNIRGTNEITTQADIEDPDDASESGTIVEEAHVETQTDPEVHHEVEIQVVKAAVKVETKRPEPVSQPIPLPPPPPRPPPLPAHTSILKEDHREVVAPSTSLHNLEEECSAELDICNTTPLTAAAACTVMDECFPGFTECNDLDFRQLYGMAKDCVDEVKEFGRFFISQCLEFMQDDDCDPCTHRQGNQAMLGPNCAVPGAAAVAAEDEEWVDCDDDEEGASGQPASTTKAANPPTSTVVGADPGLAGGRLSKTQVEFVEKVQVVEIPLRADVEVDLSNPVSLQESQVVAVEESISGTFGNADMIIVKVEDSKSGAEVTASVDASSVKVVKSEASTGADSVTDADAKSSQQSVSTRK